MSGLNRDNVEFFDLPVAPFAAEFLSALNTQKTWAGTLQVGIICLSLLQNT